ncbi:MAG TPA: S26 family signal peptidase, partial [Bacteroidia bacterium]|nr:S26 family signal peptidase [Bacteroidia bacterium]
FPYSSQYSWNADYYGKIYIPKKNDTLRLDTTNIRIYASVIREENNTLEIKGDSIFISGLPSMVYVTQQNYFFVLGDNRDNANDSRSWGFLPEKYIVGKVSCRIRKGKK